jgi:hypothetical protein
LGVCAGAFLAGHNRLVGVHPEAPATWRRGLPFSTPIDVDHAYAAMLINAALNRRWLPHD